MINRSHEPMLRKKPLILPVVFTLGLLSLCLLRPVRESGNMLAAFLGVGAVLLLWNILLVLRSERTVRLEVHVKRQHYLQACAQGAVFLYWGWYWPQVYDAAAFILAQLLFAYAYDMLLCWSRRDTYHFGFSPLPVIFSINLFLWFKPDWFHLQFLMVAVGFAAKEFLQWSKEGRRTHIFNPSSFPLAVFSVGLLATGTSDLTWGREIATTQFYPPHIYLFLFAIALPGQFFFGVTSMTMSAVVSTYLFGLGYYAVTGVYFFYDSYIPIAVFLGMHLLFTDPSTSPRTEAGRIMFGAVYGLSTVAIYQLLGSAGLPTFYDKLLQVPLLNLSVNGLDRLARSPLLRPLDPARIGGALAPHQRHLAYMSLWAAVFGLMSFANGVGDNHPGQWLPFWRQACDEGRAYACPYLADRQLQFCGQGSGWACNEAGLLHIALARSGEDLRRVEESEAEEPFSRGCDLGFEPACQNLNVLRTQEGRFVASRPSLSDLPIILKGSKGPVRADSAAELYALACREGWTEACRQPADWKFEGNLIDSTRE